MSLSSPLIFLYNSVKLGCYHLLTDFEYRNCYNVLLNTDMEAHVSDFGTAKFLKPDSSNWTAAAGTLATLLQVNFYSFSGFVLHLKTLIFNILEHNKRLSIS